MNIHLSSEPEDSQGDHELQNKIDHFNMTVTGDHDYHPVRIFLRDESGTSHGGILADVWGGWLYVRVLWVDDDLRKHGYGAQLLQAAEDEGRRLGCQSVHLESFSFQAADFYPRFGYEVIATLPDYPPGHTKYYFRKTL